MTGSRDTVGIPGYVDPPWFQPIRAMADREHLAEASRQTLTLGQLMTGLGEAPDLPVIFAGPTDLAGLNPVEFISWRGVYADLALTPAPGGERMTTRQLLELCRAAEGATFEGYKGGDFVMSADTPVWVDYYGEVHRWGITSISCASGDVVLLNVRDWDEA